MVARRHSPLVLLITIIVPPNIAMTAPIQKEQLEIWHPRYRADKQLIHFISKDDQKFAFDKAILSKER